MFNSARKEKDEAVQRERRRSRSIDKFIVPDDVPCTSESDDEEEFQINVGTLGRKKNPNISTKQVKQPTVQSDVRRRPRRSRSFDTLLDPVPALAERLTSRKGEDNEVIAGKRTTASSRSVVAKEQTFEESWVGRMWRTPGAKPRAPPSKPAPLPT